jgi:peptidoglycan/xylan/chitin deacetylase (PgdA/CDA1 family)
MSQLLVAALRRFGTVLYWCRLHGAVMWLSRHNPKVLLYHACEPAESAATRGLASNTPPERFAADLDFLQRYYTVVPLSALEGGSAPERAVVLTFDDGYRSVFQHAYPLLRERGLSATVYLVSDVVGTGALVWVNELNYLLRTRAEVTQPLVARALGRDAEERPEALLDLARALYNAERIGALLAEIRAVTGPLPVDLPRLYLNWDEIGEMRAHGITFGNHTANHPNLARLDRVGQRDAMVRARDDLSARIGAPTSLAYPFGDHDDVSRTLAVETGHVSIMEVGGVNAPLDLIRVARTPVAARSDAELFAEIEVITPVKGWLRRLVGL